MLHCGGKNHPIHYLSDYKLTVLARYDINELEQSVIETLWTGTQGVNAGPVVFPSALDAEIIRQIENKHVKPHQNKWERWNLSAIDLPQMMSILGGIVTVNIFNAYVSSPINTLVAASNMSCPRMSLIPIRFNNHHLPKDGSQITIEFNHSIFEGLRKYWNEITGDEYVSSINTINQSTDHEVEILAKQAVD